MFRLWKRTGIYIVLLLVFSFSLFINFHFSHRENDEVVYQTLIRKISCQKYSCFFPDLRRYNLQDSAVLKILDKSVYQNKLFFRPPAFEYLAALFYPYTGNVIVYVIPPLLYALFPLLIYGTVKLISREKNRALAGFYLGLFSPFLIFHAFKIWTDLFLTFFIFLSFFLLVFYIWGRKSAWLVFGSGLALTIAALTKYQALVFMPFFLFLLHKYAKRNFRVNIIVFSVPFLLFAYWLVFVLQYHPTLAYFFSNKPTAEELSKFPFVNYVANRPTSYYFLSLFTLNPVYVLLIVPFIGKFKQNYERQEMGNYFALFRWLLIFSGLYIFIFSVLSASGSTFQNRYILPIQPFLITCLALIPLKKHPVMKSLAVVLVIFAVFNVSLNVIYHNAELFSLPEIIGLPVRF